MGFQLSDAVDRNKVFLVRRREVEGRLDPFCYIPDLVNLDNLLKSKTSKRLKDYAISHAGGATPNKKEAEIHYTTQDNGIPFIRVQNLSTTGELSFDNLKYITKETHNGLLKRSKVFEGDLLIKITGVGRMAIASVAPNGFEGNINQHIVVIKTGSKEISQNLSAYINLDSVEKIASKRSTGGTRPALDYPALFSLPTINDKKIFYKINTAVQNKKEKEAEAQRLLDSIDGYLLKALGIELPEEEENTIEKRMFVRKFGEVSGGRLDPLYHSGNIFRFIQTSKYDFNKLRNLLEYMKSGFAAGKNEQSMKTEDIIQIRPTNINEESEFIFDRNVYIDKAKLNTHKEDMLNVDEVLFNNTNSQEQVGKTIYFNLGEDYFCSNHITRIKTSKNLSPQYLADLFNLYRRKLVFYRLCTNWNNQSGIGLDVLGSILIPLPPFPKQTQIAGHIKSIRSKAKQLRAQAAAKLEQAKKEVEKMILGDTDQ